MRSSQLTHIIETAYGASANDDVWLRNLVAAMSRVLDFGLGVVGWLHDLRKLPETASLTSVGLHPAVLEQLIDEGHTLGKVLQPLFRKPVATNRDVLGPRMEGIVHRAGALNYGLVDGLGLFCTDVDGLGVGFAANSPRVLNLTRHERQRWARLVAHVTAAFRLHRRRGATEAVLTAAGKVRHAEGLARPPRAREALRDAAINFDRARTSGCDPDEALDLHRALVAGRWTLVDTFDRDGKRYLIARLNTPTPAPAPELSPRETQVAVFAAMGHPLKLIAYDLGLTESCVATYLRRALVKLHLPDRLALVDHLGTLLDPGNWPNRGTERGRENTNQV